METPTKNIEKELLNIAVAVVSALEKQLGSEGLGSSDLSKKIDYTVKDMFLSISLPKYSVYVDEGTKPHTPPVSAIQKWADEKGLNAWGVVKNIEKYGTQPQPFLFKISETMINNEGALADAGLIDLLSVTDKIFENSGGELKK